MFAEISWWREYGCVSCLFPFLFDRVGYGVGLLCIMAQIERDCMICFGKI